MPNRLTIPEGSIPQFHELYVISDLHLGGPPGFQIFNSGAELKRLINHLGGRPAESRVALLINGDFVDFLAERPSVHFDPAGAIEKLDRIATKDPAFTPVFKALKEYVATENRSLILTLGNHDLELALPWVRDHLLRMLAGDDEAARGRITLAFDGAGYLCGVGKSKVLCIHGNEIDDWNVADYETIRRFGREVVQGRPVESWIPNAGAQLVVDVMNDLKSRYPFVDLLKPEMEAVIPTLVALQPDLRGKLGAISGFASRLMWDKLKLRTGFLGAEQEEENGTALRGRTLEMAGIAAAMMPGWPTAAGNGLNDTERREQQSLALLDKAEEHFNRGLSPMALVAADQRGEFLGWSSRLVSAARTYWKGGDKVEVLRAALLELSEDSTFNPDDEQDIYFKTLDELIGDSADFLIAGHTHLERALERKKGRGWYFNSGTWARLIKLEKSVLNNENSFKDVFKAFEAGTMEALDEMTELVKRQLTVVAVIAEGEKTYGELRHVSTQPGGKLFPRAATHRFPRS